MISSQITDGPSKFDLMLALFDRKVERTFWIMTRDGRLYLRISGCDVVDDESETWQIKGRARLAASWEQKHGPLGYMVDFNATYSTKTRDGSVSIA